MKVSVRAADTKISSGRIVVTRKGHEVETRRLGPDVWRARCSCGWRRTGTIEIYLAAMSHLEKQPECAVMLGGEADRGDAARADV
jgi:hypothetical protein